MSFTKYLQASINDLHNYSTTDIRVLTTKYNIPFFK